MSASHRRWDGRQKMMERTVWTLHVGALQVRCVHGEPGQTKYVLQGRSSKGWNLTVGGGDDARRLLQMIANSKGAADALARMGETSE